MFCKKDMDACQILFLVIQVSFMVVIKIIGDKSHNLAGYLCKIELLKNYWQKIITEEKTCHLLYLKVACEVITLLGVKKTFF